MEASYTPDGVRIAKKRIWNLGSYWHKYIVDTTGDLPKILLVLDANDNNAILKTYIHANNQILCQHDGDVNSPRYFYLHDRLGSVRQIINSSGTVENCYYYTPWGGTTGSETDETVSNWYGWAGYLSDEEISSYYCNARQYNAAQINIWIAHHVYGHGGTPTLNPNKLNHIFRPGHNLGSLVDKFGSQEKAYWAVWDAFQKAVAAGGYAEGKIIEEVTVNIGGYTIVVSGRLLGGIAEIGTFYIP